MPSTTITNTTTSFSIGASLDEVLKKDPEAKAGISASYSESYTCPYLTMQDMSNIAANQAYWQAPPKQPVFLGDGFVWSPPANVAHTNYQYKPSVLIQTAKGDPLEISAEAILNIKFYSWWNLQQKETYLYETDTASLTATLN